MKFSKVLIANRGEIAIRIARAAQEIGFETTAIFAEDEDLSLHIRKANHAVGLQGKGLQAYLDIDQIVKIATEKKCDAIHPGYGFLSENYKFAQKCQEAGISFVGPTPEALRLFGDKLKSRALAKRCEVPLWPGTNGATTLEEATAFMKGLGEGKSVMLKAVSGGGGRGIKPVHKLDELEDVYNRCQAEAKMSFGDGALYVEQLVNKARHIEVQIVGDQHGNVTHLWERECSVQRRNQKLIEIAPSPFLPTDVRDEILQASLKMAKTAEYSNVGTFEFLVDMEATANEQHFAFMEANPRVQVEHTVTEEVTGVDIVKTQLALASGATLEDLGLGLGKQPAATGHAVQLRLNMETMQADGSTRPSGGVIEIFEPPLGPGMRTDSFAYAGYKTSFRYDSMLAKIIAYSRSSDFDDAIRRVYRGLCELKLVGVKTNKEFLQNILQHEAFAAGKVHTKFVEEKIVELAAVEDAQHPTLYFPAED